MFFINLATVVCSSVCLGYGCCTSGVLRGRSAEGKTGRQLFFRKRFKVLNRVSVSRCGSGVGGGLSGETLLGRAGFGFGETAVKFLGFGCAIRCIGRAALGDL
jgi:hypothetical protein